MSWVDRILDGDEGSLRQQRQGAVIAIWCMLVVAVLVFVAFVAALVLEATTGDDFEVPSTMLATMGLLFVIALLGQERYRRRKLEERVKALEGKA